MVEARSTTVFRSRDALRGRGLSSGHARFTFHIPVPSARGRVQALPRQFERRLSGPDSPRKTIRETDVLFLLIPYAKLSCFSIFTMAGIVRQPIDKAALERYIDKYAPEIKTPLELKQVWSCDNSSELEANEDTVRFRSIESYISPYS